MTVFKAWCCFIVRWIFVAFSLNVTCVLLTASAASMLWYHVKQPLQLWRVKETKNVSVIVKITLTLQDSWEDPTLPWRSRTHCGNNLSKKGCWTYVSMALPCETGRRGRADGPVSCSLLGWPCYLALWVWVCWSRVLVLRRFRPLSIWSSKLTWYLFQSHCRTKFIETQECSVVNQETGEQCLICVCRWWGTHRAGEATSACPALSSCMVYIWSYFLPAAAW